MEGEKTLRVSFTTEMITPLRAGDMCYIPGTMYTVYDAAYLRLIEMLKRDEETSSNFEGQVIYYASPCPAKPGQPIGPVGPATGGRMDAYSPMLIAYDLHAMIGKGSHNPEVVNATKQYKGVYLAAIGGAAALVGKCVKEAEVIVFDDLGPRAIRKPRVEELPIIVTVDSLRGSVYSLGRSQYTRH